MAATKQQQKVVAFLTALAAAEKRHGQVGSITLARSLVPAFSFLSSLPYQVGLIMTLACVNHYLHCLCHQTLTFYTVFVPLVYMFSFLLFYLSSVFL
jgi:hypothetical protein